MSFTDIFGFLLDAIAKAKKLIHENLAQNFKQGYIFQLATKSCKLEPRPKGAKLFCQLLGGDRRKIMH